jgi:hypothetical protein
VRWRAVRERLIDLNNREREEEFVLLGCLTTRSFIEIHSFWRETMIPAALSDLQDATDDDHWPLLKSVQFRPGSIAGNTSRRAGVERERD